MRYPAEETAEKHDRILAQASKMFRERGFGGAGVAEIMKAAGLTHGAFYAHFPSKDALAAEALGCALAELYERNSAQGEQEPDQKRAFLRSYLSEAHRDRMGEGCAIAALGSDVARSPAMREPFTAGVRRVLDKMARSFGWKGRARRNAIHMLAATTGALVLARAVDDPALSKEILDSVREDLSAL